MFMDEDKEAALLRLLQDENKEAALEPLPKAATATLYDNFPIAEVYGRLILDSEQGQAVENKVRKNKAHLTNLIKEVKGLPPPPPPHFFRGFAETEEDPENEHFKHYMNLLAESKGYYTPKVPDGVKIAYSRPAPILPHNFDKLELRAKNALDWYNNEKKGDEIYELVRVECASQYVTCGIRYLIAFIARGVDSGHEVPFRAKVFFGVGGVITVESCERVAESSAKFAQLRGKCC